MTAPDDLTIDNFGPLLHLAGTWEGEGGVDVSYHHTEGDVGDTKYLERVTLSPFGPVDNGSQTLFGLDYRMAAWRMNELDGDPFHTEVGYWLYDAAEQQIMRCFMVPRGTVLIAGGAAEPNATSFSITAALGSTTYGVLNNRYLDLSARCDSYRADISLETDGWSYEEDTVLTMQQFDEPYHHTDRNVLRRIESA